MATTYHLGVYQPLSWLVLAVQYSLFGMSAGPYHAVSLLFHALTVVVLFFVARRVLVLMLATLWNSATADDAEQPGSAWFRPHRMLDVAAAIAALLFAVHPLRVEAVAWLSCQPYTLCAMMFLLCVYTYLLAHERTTSAEEGDTANRGSVRMGYLLLSILFALLALLAKAPAVTIPGVLVVIDLFVLRRMGGERSSGGRTWWVYIEKCIFVLVALPFAYAAAQAKADVTMSAGDWELLPRLAHASYGLWFYIVKTVWPFELLPFYELRGSIDPGDAQFAAAILAALLAGVLVILRWKKWPGVVAAALFYAVVLSPNVGFVQYGWQITADRYSYLPSMGWMLLIGGGILASYLRRAQDRSVQSGPSAAMVGLAGMVILLTGAMAWRYTLVWQDSLSLWSYTLARIPDSPVANGCMGTALVDRGRYAESLEFFQRQQAADPDSATTHYNIGFALSHTGQNAAAVEELQKALALKPDYGEAYFNMANAYMALNNPAAAVDAYRHAAELMPQDRDTHHNLAVALFALSSGDAALIDEALAEFKLTIALDPEYVEAYVNLGLAYVELGKPAQAMDSFRQALAIDPQHPRVRSWLAHLQEQQTKPEQAE